MTAILKQMTYFWQYHTLGAIEKIMPKTFFEQFLKISCFVWPANNTRFSKGANYIYTNYNTNGQSDNIKNNSNTLIYGVFFRGL